MRRELPTYEQTDKQTLYKASKHSFQNAERYSEDAKILFDTGSYGHSIALSALGMEELDKAYEFFNMALIKKYPSGFIPIKPEIILKTGNDRMRIALTDHRTKQREAHNKTIQIQSIVEQLKELSSHQTESNNNNRDKVWSGIRKSLDKASKKGRKREARFIKQYYGFIEQIDRLKLQGLYVDIENTTRKVTGPSKIRKADAQKALNMLREYLSLWEYFYFSKDAKEGWEEYKVPKAFFK